MTGVSLSESTVEAVALDWLAALGWTVLHGPDIAPDMPGAERADYGDVILQGRLRFAFARLNADVPGDTLDDAVRRLTRPAGATLEARNRDFHRMLVGGVTVEYADAGGRVRGDQVRVLDFDAPEANDWLAINQVTVVENRHERLLADRGGTPTRGSSPGSSPTAARPTHRARLAVQQARRPRLRGCGRRAERGAAAVQAEV